MAPDLKSNIFLKNFRRPKNIPAPLESASAPGRFRSMASSALASAADKAWTREPGRDCEFEDIQRRGFQIEFRKDVELRTRVREQPVPVRFVVKPFDHGPVFRRED